MKVSKLLFSLSILLLLFFYSCSSPSKITEDETEKEIEEISENESEEVILTSEQSFKSKLISPLDSSYILNELKQLKGIEKFAIKDNFYFLSSLLEKKGLTVKYDSIKQILEGTSEYVPKYFINKLDSKNGYIKYNPGGSESTNTVVFWNLDEGSKLIASEELGCGPICESNISFQKYTNGKYETLETKAIIPEIDSLPYLLLTGYDPNSPDPYEFQYVLPQKGKNIKFCQYDKCIDLKWDRGIFKTTMSK